MIEQQQLFQKVKSRLVRQNIPVAEQEPLAGHTSFRIGGPAALFASPETEEQLCQALAIAAETGVRRYLLGNGSNVLFADEGFAGLVIHTGKALGQVKAEGEMVEAQAGAGLQQVCRAARDAGLAGLEFAYGIPGSVGGAVYMNAGAYGGEMKDVLAEVVCADEKGQLHTMPADWLELGYRTSCLERNGWCLVRARLRLHPGDKEAISAAMEDYMGRRRDKQPLDKPSAGSAFKRPVGAFASALIDQCGLKGYRVGGAAISEKHAGFIVNLGGASCADVLAVAEDVSRIVKEKTGFVLEKEIRVVR